MDPLAAHILSVCNQAPSEVELSTVRPKLRRATWIPLVGERVNCWRIVSRDPDEDEDNFGAYIGESPERFYIQLDGDDVATRFEKKSRHGVTVYRIHKLIEVQK